jgi:hypothetical protein
VGEEFKEFKEFSVGTQERITNTTRRQVTPGLVQRFYDKVLLVLLEILSL